MKRLLVLIEEAKSIQAVNWSCSHGLDEANNRQKANLLFSSFSFVFTLSLGQLLHLFLFSKTRTSAYCHCTTATWWCSGQCHRCYTRRGMLARILSMEKAKFTTCGFILVAKWYQDTWHMKDQNGLQLPSHSVLGRESTTDSFVSGWFWWKYHHSDHIKLSLPYLKQVLTLSQHSRVRNGAL